MTITLPLPAKELSPNARVHWAVRSREVKKHRHMARATVLGFGELAPVMDGTELNPPTGYQLAFYLPDRHRRDQDNMIARCKAYLDGISDAVGVDDSRLFLQPPLVWEVDRENPRVEVTLVS